jgi:hypothetical protein
MKKLNGSEIDVIVNEICKNVREEKLSKVKVLLDKDNDYLEIINLYSKVEEIKNKEKELKDEIELLNKEINKKYKCRINDSNNYYNNKVNLKINFDYKDEEIYSYYNVKNKVILSCISKEFNLEEFIKKFVEEFVS